MPEARTVDVRRIDVWYSRCCGPNWQICDAKWVKSAPVMLIRVPPSAGPELGERLTTFGTKCDKNGTGVEYCCPLSEISKLYDPSNGSAGVTQCTVCMSMGTDHNMKSGIRTRVFIKAVMGAVLSLPSGSEERDRPQL